MMNRLVIEIIEQANEEQSESAQEEPESSPSSDYQEPVNSFFQRVEIIPRASGYEGFDSILHYAVSQLRGMGYNTNEDSSLTSRRSIEDSSAILLPGSVIEDASDKLCSVCLDDMMTDEDVMMVENCSHTFHRDCLTKWYQHKNMCPTCRGII